MYVLFEHAAGYSLFRVKEFEDAGAFLPQIEQSVTDLSRFNGVVKLVAFAPFKSAAHALDNINSISEGGKVYLRFLDCFNNLLLLRFTL